MEPSRRAEGEAFARRIAPLRRELLLHCYRLAGSFHEAEDLLQEGLARAWAAFSKFEERATLRTWLYRIVTNVCLDALKRHGPRSLPPEKGPPVDPTAPLTPNLEPVWLEPFPEHLLPETVASPEVRYTARESVALAFLTLLQLLPPRQRAVLVLHDVMGWSTTECAKLLGSTVPAVNSAIQRARQSLAGHGHSSRRGALVVDDEVTQALLHRYVRAWEEADVRGLVALLAEDATLSMPPLSGWLQGAADIGESLAQMVLTPGSSGHLRLVSTRANGLPAFGAYRLDSKTQEFRALSIQLVNIKDGRIQEIHAFLDTSLFAGFGLPDGLAVDQA